MAYSVDVVVVGAGVVGLACAKYLSGQGLDTLVVESEALICLVLSPQA